MAARTPMTTITTRSSTMVKAFDFLLGVRLTFFIGCYYSIGNLVFAMKITHINYNVNLLH